MALLTCPECKREASSTLAACPHCGYRFLWVKEGRQQPNRSRIRAERALREIGEENRKESIAIIYGILALLLAPTAIVAIGLGIAAMNNSTPWKRGYFMGWLAVVLGIAALGIGFVLVVSSR